MKRIFNLFKSQKTPLTVSLKPGDSSFDVPKSITLLQAAINNDIKIPYHCTVGTCGNCRCKLVDGEIRPIMDFSYTLSKSELDDGYILACQSFLKTDITLELEVDKNQPNQPLESYKGVIKNTHMLTHDIMSVSVELDRPIQFSAGQFADVGLEGFSRHRSYSFACAPEDAGQTSLDFHVRKVPGGSYTEWLFEQDRKNETFELHGPSGAFWLRSADAPILAIAGGSGMAPLKSILDDALNKGINRPVSYIFGARSQQDLYCLDEMHALAEKWPSNFKFIPVLSEEPADSNWTGKRGFVTDYIDDNVLGFPVSESHAYLCGPPPMIDAVLVKLDSASVSLDNIHYDKFLDSRQLEN